MELFSLVLAFTLIVKISNTNFFLIPCFKERNTMVVEKNLQVKINFYEKHVIQLSHGITSSNTPD